MTKCLRLLILTYFLLLYKLNLAYKIALKSLFREIIMAEVIMLDRRMQTLVNDYVPTDEVLNDLVDFFTIFSDYTRLKMISALAITEMCVSDISTILGINQTTVSHQLRLLKNLNAVTSRRVGKVVFYSLKNDILSEVLLKGVEFLGF